MNNYYGDNYEYGNDYYEYGNYGDYYEYGNYGDDYGYGNETATADLDPMSFTSPKRTMHNLNLKGEHVTQTSGAANTAEAEGAGWGYYAIGGAAIAGGLYLLTK